MTKKQLALQANRQSEPGISLKPEIDFARAEQQLAEQMQISVVDLRIAIGQWSARTHADGKSSPLDRALADYAERNFSAAESDALRAAKATTADAVMALRLAGSAQRAQGKLVQAENSYRLACERIDRGEDEQTWIDTNWELGTVLDELGRHSDALLIWRDVLSLQEARAGRVGSRGRAG